MWINNDTQFLHVKACRNLSLNNATILSCGKRGNIICSKCVKSLCRSQSTMSNYNVWEETIHDVECVDKSKYRKCLNSMNHMGRSKNQKLMKCDHAHDVKMY